MRLAVGGISHETNTYSSVPTGVAQSRARLLVRGQALANAFTGTRTEIGGMLDQGRSLGATMVPTFFAAATPPGLVTREAFDGVVGKLPEADPRVISLNVAGGVPYADVERAGMSFLVTTNGDPELAQE